MTLKKLQLALIACLSCLPLSAEEMPHAQSTYTSFAPFTGRIVGSKVRMRLQPNLDSVVVRETNPGEMFAVVGEDKGYYAVQPNRAAKGYVFRTFVLDGVVECDRVNIRMSPDTEAPVIGRLSAGEKVTYQTCEANNKWLEIQVPKTIQFFIAKEYIENAGPVELVAQVESRQEQAYHLLNAAFLNAKAEIQKPFDEIAFEGIHQRFSGILDAYKDIPEIVSRTKEAELAIEEAYVQKKIAFLESKADRTVASREIDPAQLQKLSQIGQELKADTKDVSEMGKAASSVLGQGMLMGEATDKMMVWQTFEESLYHLWAVAHEGKTIADFYDEEACNATVLTGIVEPFNKPVKNRPGDYILRANNMPVAFLYSTKVNLHELVGKKVTLTTTPRPNNNFAFPAYFVIAAE